MSFTNENFKTLCIMKTNYILKTLAMLFFVFTATAQQGINYKAIIKGGDGNAIANTATTVQFTILENGSTSVYQETHTPTTDANGIIIVNIGEGTLISGDFNGIDWGGNPHFLKTEIDSGSGLTDMGTTEFKTVPYALYAKTAESISGIITETQNLANVIAIDNAANAQIKNVTDPTDSQDAATKAYVDITSPCDDLYILINSLYNELYTTLNKSGAPNAILDPPVTIIGENYVDNTPPISILLSWVITDPYSDPSININRELLSDVYFQTPSAAMKFSNLLAPSLIVKDIEFEPGVYHWQVVVKDYFNNVTIGPLLTFTVDQD